MEWNGNFIATPYKGFSVTTTYNLLYVGGPGGNLIPRVFSAFKMTGGREDPGEEQVTCLQKYWRF